jgi:hypothetical protein
LFNEHIGMSVTNYLNRTRIALAHELVTGSHRDMEMVAERWIFLCTAVPQGVVLSERDASGEDAVQSAAGLMNSIVGA